MISMIRSVVNPEDVAVHIASCYYFDETTRLVLRNPRGLLVPAETGACERRIWSALYRMDQTSCRVGCIIKTKIQLFKDIPIVCELRSKPQDSFPGTEFDHIQVNEELPQTHQTRSSYIHRQFGLREKRGHKWIRISVFPRRLASDV